MSDLIYTSTDYNKYMIQSLHDYENRSPLPYQALVSQGAFNTWKTLDWAHNICVKGKLKSIWGPNILRAQNTLGQKGRLKTIYGGQNILNQDTSNIVQTAGLTAFTCEPLEARKRNANFENHMKPKCPRSCLVALMNTMIQETPNFFFSKDNNFRRSSLVRSSLHCRNKPLSTINWILFSPHLGLCKLP